MTVRTKVERLERAFPPLDDSPEARRERLTNLLKRDAEVVDLVIRMAHIKDRRYPGASREELARARTEDPDLVRLMARFDARAVQVQAGAPLKTDQTERWRRRAAGRPTPEEQP